MRDFGQENEFNIQRGQRLAPSLWARFGVHASTLGLGLDVGNSLHPPLSLDFYGLHDQRLDVQANLPVTRFLDLTFGLDNVFREPDPIFGIRYKR
jgi:hypothetical protein